MHIYYYADNISYAHNGMHKLAHARTLLKSSVWLCAPNFPCVHLAKPNAYTSMCMYACRRLFYTCPFVLA